MKRVAVLFVASLVLVPALALGQTVPATPVPPAVPVTPAVRPIRAVPAIDVIDLEDAIRTAQSAANQIDRQAIRESVRVASEGARQASEAARVLAQVDMQQAVHQIDAMSYQFDNMRHDFDFQQSYSMLTGQGDSSYSGAMSLMNDHKYEEAVVRFDRVINQKGTNADGALYWKANCQARLGKPAEAVTTLGELRKAFPQSRYLKDASALEAEVRKLGPDQVGDDEDIKLLAIQALQNQDSEKALPYLEKALASTTNSLRLKQRAITVLASNDQPRAHTVLLGFAKGTAGNPDLQRYAIRYLGSSRSQKTTTAELIDIYNSTPDYDIRYSVIGAFKSAGAKSPLLDIASGQMTWAGAASGNTVVRNVNGGTTTISSNDSLRAHAISNLSDLVSPQEVWPLYQKEENKDLRLQWVGVFSSMGAVDQLNQIVKTEKEPSVRNRAISALGNNKVDKTGTQLTDLYTGDNDQKMAVIRALSNQNNAEGLVAVYRKETDKNLKVEVVRSLTNMAKNSKVAMDFLMELLAK